MSSLVGGFSAVTIALAILLGLLGIFAAMALFARNYIKVPPSQVAIFYGRKQTLVDEKGGRTSVGFRVVRGGAGLRLPVLEQVAYLSLNIISIPLKIQRAYTKEGVPVTVEAVANVKIAGDDMSLRSAAERFLGMSVEQIKGVIFQTLEGHLRAILGTLTVEEINADRQAFAQKMTDEAAVDLKKMGVNIDILTIQQISDEEGYLDALGKKRTAEVKRDAVIGEALAQRDAMIQSANADQEGKTKRYEADVTIAQSLRDKETRQAEFSAAVQSKQAEAGQAGPLATAIAKQKVTEQETRIDQVRKAQEVLVQEQEALRKEKELQATVVKPAEAGRQAAILKAEGEKQATIIKAEATQKELEYRGRRRGREDREDRPRRGREGPRHRRGRGRGHQEEAAGGGGRAPEEVGGLEELQRGRRAQHAGREDAGAGPGLRHAARGHRQDQHHRDGAGRGRRKRRRQGDGHRRRRHDGHARHAEGPVRHRRPAPHPGQDRRRRGRGRESRHARSRQGVRLTRPLSREVNP